MNLFPLAFSLFLLSYSLWAEPQPTEFRADHFSRDLVKKKETGKGRAYLKRLNREVWADEIEFNLEDDSIIASGNVHMRAGGVDIYATRGVYSLASDTATLDDATLIAGQMVVSGESIHKLSSDHFEVIEGYYTNCNNDKITDLSATKCSFDWKIYAHKFDIRIEGYLHMFDALIYTKDLPILYFPYYLAPAKTKRSSGFLLASVLNVPDLGTGFRAPYFQVLGDWHDLTIQPTLWSKGGKHLGLQYEYAYSHDIRGTAKLFLTDRSLSLDRNAPRAGESNKAKLLGTIGEFGVDISHIYSLGQKARSTQSIRYVSDPYYPSMYTDDFGAQADFSYLRSQLTAIFPMDDYSIGAAATGYQSLILSKSSGRDLGPVSQLPSIVASKKSVPILPGFLSYNVDTRFSNYYRSARAYDSIPETAPATRDTPSSITNEDFHGNDYLREGRRLQIEPQVVANLPMGTGFQLQPSIKAGELLYHFDLPSTTFVNREYADLSIPFSMYLSRVYPTTLDGFEEVKHVFQPRAIYARSLYRSAEPNHPFFYRPSDGVLTPGDPQYNPNAFISPRFDVIDLVTPFEYFRLELGNRLLRQSEEVTERFFLIEIANSYNFKTSPLDPRYKGALGPLELTTELTFSPITLTLTGLYQLKATPRVGGGEDVHESRWNGSLGYSSSFTNITLGAAIDTPADPIYEEMLFTFTGAQRLPLYVDLATNFEYSAKKGKFRSYGFSINLAQKPTSCWQLGFNFAKPAARDPEVRVIFQMNLGGPLGFSSSEMRT